MRVRWRHLLFVILSLAFSLCCEATDKIYIFTVDEGLFSPIHRGSVYFFHPEVRDADRMNLDRMGRQEFGNCTRFSRILSELHDRGYQIIIKVSPPPSEFLSAVEDPDTVFMIHEGHGIINSEHPEIVALKIGDKTLARDVLDEYLQTKNETEIKPSAKLKAIYTQACYGQVCESYYRPRLNLPKNVEWIGSYKPVDPFNTPALLDRFEKNILPKFPPVGKSCDIEVLKHAKEHTETMF